MNFKLIGTFVGGMVVGAVAGIFGTYKRFQKQAKDEIQARIDELEDYYDHCDIYRREDDLSSSLDNSDSDEEERTKEDRSALRNRVRNSRERVSYSSMYDTQRPENDDISENDTTYNDEETADETYIDDTSATNHKKPPRIISAEASQDLPEHYETEALFFYSVDGVLTDEDDNVIENPELIIGDALHKYGFADGREQLIFVQNFDLEKCYEVQKVNASYSEYMGKE